MPQVEDSAPQNCPHFRRPSKSPSTSPVLLTDQVCVGGSHDLISRFRNLLEGLTELRKTVHLLEYRSVTERRNSGAAPRKLCVETCSPTRKLADTHSSGDFTEASNYRLKKMHNLQTENCVLFGDLPEDLGLRGSLSQL